jgi:regulator of nucleoside diphosphate kinase
MKRADIQITNYDMERLQELLSLTECLTEEKKQVLHKLDSKLRRAEVLFWKEISNQVVTMNSQVRLREYDTEEELDLDIVFPDDASPKWNRISILTPLGIALIGQSVGDCITWTHETDTNRFKILKVLFQPETNGRCKIEETSE